MESADPPGKKHSGIIGSPREKTQRIRIFRPHNSALASDSSQELAVNQKILPLRRNVLEKEVEGAAGPDDIQVTYIIVQPASALRKTLTNPQGKKKKIFWLTLQSPGLF